MIVEASGLATTRTVSTAGASMIVSTTGTAYVKKGKIKAFTRIIKKIARAVVKVVKASFVCVVRKVLSTKSGKPTSIDPPSEVHVKV